jgi:hypothetical protein
METPYVDCSPADEHESETGKGTAYDNEDRAFREGRGLDEWVRGYYIVGGNDDLVGGDVGWVLSNARETGCEGR